jgi:predicted nucleotidyltransferase
MTLPESHQKTIAKIVEIIKNSVGADLVSIIIFGSFVRGEFTEKSDYDVLIVISDYEDVKSRGFCILQFPFCNYIILYYVTVVCSNISPVCV